MNRKYALLFAILLPVFVLCSCGYEKYTDDTFFAMDTVVYMQIQGANESDIKNIENMLSDIENDVSKTVPESCVYRFNESENGGVLSGYAGDIMKRAIGFAKKTDGKFDFTLGRLSDLWNITGGSEYVPKESEINEALKHCGYEKIKESGENIFTKTDSELKIDFGACAKGYASDLIIKDLKKCGFENAMVSLGGNISVTGSSEKNLKTGKHGWNIAIKNPFDTTGIVGTVTATDITVAVSGDYERYFEKDGVRYHHILDRLSGYPAWNGLKSTAVFSKDGITADALSTALFVAGYEESMKIYNSKEFDFEAIFICQDGNVYTTDGIREFFEPCNDAFYNDRETLKFN